VLNLESKLNQQLFMYMLSVAVLFTMGMDFSVRSNYYSDTISNSSMNINANEQVADFSILPLTHRFTEHLAQTTSWLNYMKAEYQLAVK
jgi:hypothetical protein